MADVTKSVVVPKVTITDPNVISRIKRVALIQTMCIVLTTFFIVIVTAFVTRVQHHIEDELPVSKKRAIHSEVRSAAIRGLEILKAEKTSPNKDTTNRIRKMSEVVAAMELADRIINLRDIPSKSNIMYDKLLSEFKGYLKSVNPKS